MPQILHYIKLFFLFLALYYPINANNIDIIDYCCQYFWSSQWALFIFYNKNSFGIGKGGYSWFWPTHGKWFVTFAVTFNNFNWLLRKRRMQNFIFHSLNRLFDPNIVRTSLFNLFLFDFFFENLWYLWLFSLLCTLLQLSFPCLYDLWLFFIFFFLVLFYNFYFTFFYRFWCFVFLNRFLFTSFLFCFLLCYFL